MTPEKIVALVLLNFVPFLLPAATTSTTIQLASNPNPSTFGAPVALTASVSAPTATGEVTFYDGTMVLGTVPVVSGRATLTTIALSPGARSVRALYAGDATFAASTSATVTQTVQITPDGGFAQPTSFGSIASPQSVVLADLNGDGKVDFAVAGTSGVTVLLGDGDGTFQQTVSLVTGSVPSAIATGDFNGDGFTDLAVTNGGGNQSLSMFLGNGDGTFQAATNATFGTANLGSIATGDFNADGKVDLAIVDSTNNEVNIFLGNGDGTFGQPTAYAVGEAPDFVVVSDFNADGKGDLAVANGSGGTVSILTGNGDGTFEAAVSSAVGANPSSIAVADFNADGKPDLAVANRGSSISILLGHGDGTFGTAVNLTEGEQPISILAVDLNGDGKIDLVFADFAEDELDALLGNGDGTFGTPVRLPGGTNPTSVALGDFNGDGRPDLVASDFGGQGLSVLIGVAQTMPGCTYTVTPAMPTVPALGGDLAITIQTGATCAWVVTGLPNWITVSGAATGTGPATVSLVVAPNTGAQRGALVVISDQFVTVTQLSSEIYVNPTGVVNAASFSSAVAPGSLAAVFGNFLVSTPASAASVPIATSLSGVSLEFGAVFAPLFYVSSLQVNVQVPWELAGDTQTTVVATFNGQSSATQTLNVAPYAPGIFSLDSGSGQGAILDSSYQVVTPANPTTAGNTIQIYCTGLGPVTNQPATGAAAPSSPPLAETMTLPIVTIGGATATVTYSGLASGSVGEYQVNVVVPATAATGSAVPVTITIGSIVSNTVGIGVQ